MRLLLSLPSLHLFNTHGYFRERPPCERTENVRMIFYTIIITSSVLFMSSMRSVCYSYDITIHLTTESWCWAAQKHVQCNPNSTLTLIYDPPLQRVYSDFHTAEPHHKIILPSVIPRHRVCSFLMDMLHTYSTRINPHVPLPADIRNITNTNVY